MGRYPSVASAVAAGRDSVAGAGLESERLRLFRELCVRSWRRQLLERGTGNGEPGTGSREPGAGNRERGTERRAS